MNERSSQLTGVAGVHYVAAYLAFRNVHAVPTTRNVAGPDLLISNLSGSRSLSLQVKTTNWAMRTRGRGVLKQPHHCEWDIGWSSATINHPHVLFALVDLKEFQELPDVYVVPSVVIHAYFKGGDPNTWRRARYHPEIAEIEPYKNNWSALKELLE